MAASKNRKHEDLDISVAKCKIPELQNLQDGFSNGTTEFYTLAAVLPGESQHRFSYITPTADNQREEGRRRGDGGRRCSCCAEGECVL